MEQAAFGSFCFPGGCERDDTRNPFCIPVHSPCSKLSPVPPHTPEQRCVEQKKQNLLQCRQFYKDVSSSFRLMDIGACAGKPTQEAVRKRIPTRTPAHIYAAVLFGVKMGVTFTPEEMELGGFTAPGPH